MIREFNGNGQNDGRILVFGSLLASSEAHAFPASFFFFFFLSTPASNLLWFKFLILWTWEEKAREVKISETDSSSLVFCLRLLNFQLGSPEILPPKAWEHQNLQISSSTLPFSDDPFADFAYRAGISFWVMQKRQKIVNFVFYFGF